MWIGNTFIARIWFPSMCENRKVLSMKCDELQYGNNIVNVCNISCSVKILNIDCYKAMNSTSLAVNGFPYRQYPFRYYHKYVHDKQLKREWKSSNSVPIVLVEINIFHLFHIENETMKSYSLRITISSKQCSNTTNHSSFLSTAEIK